MQRILFTIFCILLLTPILSLQPNIGLAQDTTSGIAGEGWKDFTLIASPPKASLKRILIPAQLKDGNKHDDPVQGYDAYLTGIIEDGQSITIIDADKNNQFNDYGTDIIVFGDSPYGIPFGKMVNIKNKLYHFKLDSAKHIASLKPYDGEVGKVDMMTKYDCNAQPDLIILTSGNDDYYDVAKSKSYALPCGSYSLYLGFLVSGKAMHMVINGEKMDKIEVKKAEATTDITTVKWGGPLICDFQVEFRKPPEPKKDPKNPNKPAVKHPFDWILFIGWQNRSILGVGKEEYFNFMPAVTCDVIVKDSKGKLAATGGVVGAKLSTTGGG